MLTQRQTRRRALALLTALLLTSGLAAGCGGGDDDGDGVASIDGSGAEPESAAGDEGEGGGDGRPDDAEFQDAMLEYAQCMRDHGIDMPDPEFDEDGGVTQSMGEGGAGGPDGPSEEFEAADEACKPILDDAMPDMELSPEEQAERQDQMVAVAECMRDKGHDMPDPEVSSDGAVRIGRRAPEGGTTPEAEEQFEEDMEACHEEAGVEAPGGRVTRGSDG